MATKFTACSPINFTEHSFSHQLVFNQHIITFIKPKWNASETLNLSVLGNWGGGWVGEGRESSLVWFAYHSTPSHPGTHLGLPDVPCFKGYLGLALTLEHQRPPLNHFESPPYWHQYKTCLISVVVFCLMVSILEMKITMPFLQCSKCSKNTSCFLEGLWRWHFTY